MRLILIRHGESDHALRGVIAGRHSCRGLSERGFKQAEPLAQRFAVTGEVSNCQALLCSPVLRARQTAEVLARTLPVGLIEDDCNLCELHPGAADGLTSETYRATYGAFDLLTFPTRPFAPGAESWVEFAQRVRATLERLARRFVGQTVVAVTHAGSSWLPCWSSLTFHGLGPEHISIPATPSFPNGVSRKRGGNWCGSMTCRISLTETSTIHDPHSLPAYSFLPLGLAVAGLCNLDQFR